MSFKPTLAMQNKPSFFFHHIFQQPSYVLRFTFYILLPLLTACTPQNATWQRIQQDGVLRVGLDPTFPPFEQAIEGDVWGLDVDLAEAIGAELGLEVTYLYLGYDGLYDALATEQVDVLLSALVIQPERTRDVAYSTPYFNAGQVLIMPAFSPIQQIDQLTNQRLAVELGAQGHVLATVWERRLPNLTLSPMGSVDMAVGAVAEGTADVALVDHVGGRLFLQGRTDMTLAPTFVEDEPYAMVVRIEDEGLLAALNGALANTIANGNLDHIIKKWLDGDEK